MNLKLKRLVRTTSSEQYALFDLDQTDEEDELPLTIGKLDLHYTAEGVYGTMLLWDEASRHLRPDYRRAFVQVLLEDIVQPMGVPNEYVIEFFAPTLDYYEVFHNVEMDEDDADLGEEDADEDADDDLRNNDRAGRGRNAPRLIRADGAEVDPGPAQDGYAQDDDDLDDDLLDAPDLDAEDLEDDR
ncbi:MAG: hypothetical protein WDZ49_14285 [Litorilinea sp.]